VCCSLSRHVEVGRRNIKVPSIRFQLNSVRAIVSDFGVEALIADMPDLLPDILGCLLQHSKRCRRPLVIEQLKYMFPRAVLLPGAHHICDNVLKVSETPWPSQGRPGAAPWAGRHKGPS
jgi:hypothetical protein